MKKRNLILTAALFAMTASLAACGGQKPAQTQPAADTAAESKGGDKKEETKEEPKSEELPSSMHWEVYRPMKAGWNSGRQRENSPGNRILPVKTMPCRSFTGM